MLHNDNYHLEDYLHRTYCEFLGSYRRIYQEMYDDAWLFLLIFAGLLLNITCYSLLVIHSVEANLFKGKWFFYVKAVTLRE